MSARWTDPTYVAEQKERGRKIMSELWEDPAFAATVSKRMTQANIAAWADPNYAEAIKAGAAKRKTTHGLSKHPLYSVHTGIMRRCYVPAANGYRNYGGRGIAVVGDWHLPEIAVVAMAKILGPRPPGMTLDRIDNDGHYVPGNLRWATRRDQQLNIGHGTVLPLDVIACSRGAGCRCGG